MPAGDVMMKATIIPGNATIASSSQPVRAQRGQQAGDLDQAVVC
jgi:hypothetical protein